jgi:hypothetical protein
MLIKKKKSSAHTSHISVSQKNRGKKFLFSAQAPQQNKNAAGIRLTHIERFLI